MRQLDILAQPHTPDDIEAITQSSLEGAVAYEVQRLLRLTAGKELDEITYHGGNDLSPEKRLQNTRMRVLGTLMDRSKSEPYAFGTFARYLRLITEEEYTVVHRAMGTVLDLRRHHTLGLGSMHTTWAVRGALQDIGRTYNLAKS